MTTETGVKHDGEKERMGLVLGDFGLALLDVAKIGTFGAKKYTDHGWLDVENGYFRYTDAMLRHYFIGNHEALDQESGLLHDAHLAWNALARLELRLRGLKDRAKAVASLEAAAKAMPPVMLVAQAPENDVASIIEDVKQQSAIRRAKRGSRRIDYKGPEGITPDV